MLSVVFFLWRDPSRRHADVCTYTMDHVLRAKSMVDRNLSVPHRFVLVSDDDEATDVPIDRKLLALGGCWVKLMLFKPDARDNFGDRILYMDLDQVTVQSLDPMITDDEFRIAEASAKGMHYNGSMILLKTGSRDTVWDSFDPAMASRLTSENRIRATDQYWYGKCLGPSERTWGRQDGVYSFRHLPSSGDLPEDARVVFFSGPYDPSQPRLRAHHPWIKKNWR